MCCSTSAFFNILQIIGLFPIAGGTIILGALVAPELFASLERKDAGMVMTAMFGRFGQWIKFSAIILLVGKLLDLIFIQKFSFTNPSLVDDKTVQVLDGALVSTSILTLAIVLFSFYISNIMTPKMMELVNKRKSKKKDEEFQALHKKSEQLHKVNFFMAVILLLSFAW